jgi:hypothetical protein
VLVDAKPGWTSKLPELLPGEMIALFSDRTEMTIEGRMAGLEMVDTLLILGPLFGRFAFLMRAPTPSLVQSAIDHNTGILNINASRTSGGRWPTNLVLVHHPSCVRAACVERCFVSGLDKHSGERTAGGAITTPLQGPAAGKYHGHGSGRAPWTGYGDRGGASRFYPQFAAEEELRRWLTFMLSGPDLGSNNIPQLP